MKQLTHIDKVNAKQAAFGTKLGLDLGSCTVTVAAARLADTIAKHFWGRDLAAPTPKQIELAAKFGYDISSVSRGEGEAVIDDLMTQLNFETIESEALGPGVTVINIHDKLALESVISSIQKDGTVYFRGGNGRKAWARSLRRVRSV